MLLVPRADPKRRFNPKKPFCHVVLRAAGMQLGGTAAHTATACIRSCRPVSCYSQGHVLSRQRALKNRLKPSTGAGLHDEALSSMHVPLEPIQLGLVEQGGE